MLPTSDASCWAYVRRISIPLTTNFSGTESAWLYDCTQEGSLPHSRDGLFVFVGDSGNVISTRTLRVLSNTRNLLEIDWQNGLPVSTTARYGLGHVAQ